MKQKTKLQIIQKLAQTITLQDKFTRLQTLAVWASYFIQICIFQICLLISIVQPKLHISDSITQYKSIQLVLFIIRMSLPILYVITRSVYIIPFIKIMQMTNIYLLRSGFCAVPLILQFLAQMYITIRKQKRNINFDARLQSKYFGSKIFAVYIILFATFFTSNQEISKNSSAVLFCGIIYYVCACLDNVYSYKTKQILRNIALCPILMSIYFLCVPLVPAISNFGVAAHSLLSTGILLVIMFYAVTSKYSYHHDILTKKILNLQSRDKLLYVWSLIYFCQAPTQNSLVCFIRTHQSKCFNSLCPLNFNQATSSTNSTKTIAFTPESMHKAIKIYLNKALQRFASQSDQIRRLFIYYRKQDDPKIVHLLRQDDVYQKIQQYRISKNLQRYNDISLQYEQMKQIQAQTLTNVKLYLNHYDYFLSYINKESIKMQTSQQIIQELVKLKSYFLQFKPHTPANKAEQQKRAQVSHKKVKHSKGYQQINQQKTPVKKMTLKTTFLVNFMRQVYFNLPSLEKQQITAKKLTYISQDYQQPSILIISAESYNLGKIINWNTMAQKTLLYSTKQLKSKFVNDLLPKQMHKTHQKIFMKASLAIDLQDGGKQFDTFVFCSTKSSYTEVFQLHVRGTSSISGNKWIVELKQQFMNQAVVLIDQQRKVTGMNKNAINFGISQNATGQLMNQELFNKLVQNKKTKSIIPSGIQHFEGFRMTQETQWQFICPTPTYEGMPRYFIFLIENSHEIEKMTLSRFSKRNSQCQNQLASNPPSPPNGFQFNFDPYQLKYTNFAPPQYTQADLQLVWQENFMDDQNNYTQYHAYNDENDKKIINYGDNIHQMIYFQNKLQFKQNYEIATEFETHPYYLANGKMNSNKAQVNLNINKDNFIDNINKIRQKTPSYVYKLVILLIIAVMVYIVCLSLRFVQFKNLYDNAKEKELLKIEMINRKNIVANIGSLAVYFNTKQIYPTIWQNYLDNQWTFADLFVDIQYTNSRINKLNSDLGLLVNKPYNVNGKMKTLASYFQSLSIQASTQSSGQLNLTRFVTQIVDQISQIESGIQVDVNSNYDDLFKNQSRNIMIIDSIQLVMCVIVILIAHFVLRNSYFQRVNIFKSLSVIEQQQIYRIQKNLNNHRQQLKNNQLDVIQQDDYTAPLDSQNIPHTKKMFYSYMKSKYGLLYLLGIMMLATSASYFFLSKKYIQKTNKIQLVRPFIDIVGQQRNSMVQMYLNIMANTKSSTDISTDIMKNIRMFQVNKKGVIDSLIQKQFSSNYVSFYNKIWFSPCDVLSVQDSCSALFSGILADNLDYNYVYILTQVQKIIDYKIQKTASTLPGTSQFITDINTQISTSIKKINFLLFEFMIKLEKQFTLESVSQINFLYEQITRFNVATFIVLVIVGFSYLAVYILAIYLVKDLPNQNLEMITTVIPYHILMRNQYFVEWYKKKFKNIY